MRRSRLLGKPVVVTAAIVLAGAAGATAVYLTGRSNREADRRAVLAYERAVFPFAEQGGRMLVQEIRPSVLRYERGELEARALVERAATWREVFTAMRRGFAGVPEPAVLEGIGRLFDRSLARYLEAIDAFSAAAFIEVSGVDGERRKAALDRAIELAKSADTLYDRASALLQRVRRRLNLGPTAHFPDPRPS